MMTSQIPDSFQRLTTEDYEEYGQPQMIYLNPPKGKDPEAEKKRTNWIRLRAAPTPAKRHSEYLHIPELDGSGGPKILISAVMATPSSTEVYLEKFKAKRRYKIAGRKASKEGYSARPIKPAEHNHEIYEIIHSSTERQGRAIADAYDQRPSNYKFPDYLDFDDPDYQDICSGVFSPEGELVAYLLGKRVGHHVQYDEIMGHMDHVKNDVMYLLHYQFLLQCMETSTPPQCLNYGPWYSGKNPFSSKGGLNRWKRKVRFQPAYLILASS